VIADLIRRFREELLPVTIRHAAEQSSWYGAHLGRSWSDVRRVEDLALLPTTSKAVLRSVAPSRLLTSKEPPLLTQHTSGTTDAPFYVYRGKAEVEFIRSFLGHTERAGDAKAPAVFALQPSYHGDPIEVSLSEHYDNVNVLEHADVDSLFSRLKKLAVASPCGVLITGIFHHVRYFTALLQLSGAPLRECRVKALLVTGQHMSPRWRRLLEAAWGAPVVNRLSLTEGFGGAADCRSCGRFHFDQYCIPEVLDLDGHDVARFGPGLLHLTSLYPFVQLMPFIRYRTNDVVLAVPSSCAMGDGLGVEPLGRFDYCGVVEVEGHRRLIIAPLRVHDVLDEAPLINTDDVYDTHGASLLTTAVGNPKYRMRVHEGPPLEAVVEAETRIIPAHYAVTSERLGRELATQLEEAHRDLAVADPPVRWRVELLPPGSLEAIDPSTVPQCSAEERYQ
jgi:phenylacetate-coenzyme A ligase PaaK-like adenylate-forming protein